MLATEDIEEGKVGTRLTVEPPEQANRRGPYCPKCGVVNPRLYRHGSVTPIVADVPIGKTPMQLRIVRPRFRCRECGSTFVQDVLEIHPKYQATRRLVEYVGESIFHDTFTGIARRVGLDEHTIRNMADDYLQHLEESVQFTTPRWLGVDELHVNKRFRGVLTNLERKSAFDLVESREEPAMARRIRAIPNYQQIEIVCMDMSPAFRRMARKVLPDATIIADKFHVTRQANYVVETVRKALMVTDEQRKALKRERKTLLIRRHSMPERLMLRVEGWKKSFPVLEMAYDVKERFLDIYDAKDKDEALDRFHDWAANMPAEVEPYFGRLQRTMNNWQEQVFAYWNQQDRITNAYTEGGFNSWARFVSRQGRGYTFPVLRAKVLFRPELLPTVHLRARRPPTPKGVEPMMPHVFYSHGVDLSTLTRLLEEGIL